MNTKVRQLLTATILLMPTCGLHAQENKHAQAMRTAFVKTIHGKFPKNIEAKLTSFNEDSLAVAYGEWGAVDGGGLVPKEKIYVVKLSKSRAAVGPEYIEGRKFHFTQVPDDPVLPLRPILDAFDKQARYANSYYRDVAGDEQTAFPGISIAWGEFGQSFSSRLSPDMSIRIIGFKDDDGFRSTYLLTWMSEEMESTESRHKLYDINGVIFEFHCPMMSSHPQVKSYDPDEYLDRTNTGLSVAHNLVRGLQKSDPERAAALESDTLEEANSYSFQKMAQKLLDSPEALNLNTSYVALHAKIRRMMTLSRTANSSELMAICHTLGKEVNSYPFQLSGGQADELVKMIDTIGNAASDDLALHVSPARLGINSRRNLTADIDSLSEDDQNFLNRNWWYLSHLPVDYKNTAFTAHGEHYSGDSQTSYFNVEGEAIKGFHAETTLKNLRPGRYRVSAVVRAKQVSSQHSGIHIFAKTGEDASGVMRHKEIPGDGYIGGNVWFSALCRMERKAGDDEAIYVLDMNKAAANGGQGYGWNRIYIDDITVGNGTLTYGVSTRPEITHSQQIDSSWFSACDFIVERIDD